MVKKDLRSISVEVECPYCGGELHVEGMKYESFQRQVLLKLQVSETALHITQIYTLFPELDYSQIRRALHHLWKQNLASHPKRGWWSAKG